MSNASSRKWSSGSHTLQQVVSRMARHHPAVRLAAGSRLESLDQGVYQIGEV